MVTPKEMLIWHQNVMIFNISKLYHSHVYKIFEEGKYVVQNERNIFITGNNQNGIMIKCSLFNLKILHIKCKVFCACKKTFEIRLSALIQRNCNYILKFKHTNYVYSHVCVMDSHSTENCKCFNKVLIIFCKV